MIRTVFAQPLPAPAPLQPRSAIQKEAVDLGETADHRIHIDGVRWDVASDSSGKLIEKGIFSDAYLDPTKVKDVYLCIKPFTDQPRNLPGHALLEFQFEDDAPLTNSQGDQQTGLVISVEAHMHQGEAWDPSTKNPVIYQLGTWGDTLKKSAKMDYHPIDRYKLLLSHEQEVALLQDRLQVSTQSHENDIYDATNNNCLSSIIEGINQRVGPDQVIPRTLLDGSPDPTTVVPVWSPNTFAVHGLISREKPEIFPADPKPTP